MGIGIGAEYPLSSVITAEFASTEYRAYMMAWVFFMQPLGQILAMAVGWGALTGIFKSQGLDSILSDGKPLTAGQKFDILSALDTVWRCVIGVGTIPAAIAIAYRLTIPETPRYTMDVLEDGLSAFYNIRGHHNLETDRRVVQQEIGGQQPVDLPPAAIELQQIEQNGGYNLETNRRVVQQEHDGQHEDGDVIRAVNDAAVIELPPIEQNRGHNYRDQAPNHFTREKLEQYFITEGNITWLAATSFCWFLQDFAFYGLGIDNPRRIAAIWANTYPPASKFNSSLPNWPATIPTGNSSTTYSNASIPDWENPFDPTSNIYKQLRIDAFHYVITISIGSLVGGLLMITLIDRLPRKGWLVFSFIILAVLFIVMGASLQAVEFKEGHPFTIVLYMVCQFFFNFGPNTLTFIVSLNPPIPFLPSRPYPFLGNFLTKIHGCTSLSGGSIYTHLANRSPPKFSQPNTVALVTASRLLLASSVPLQCSVF